MKDFVKQRMTNVEDLWANTDYSMIRMIRKAVFASYIWLADFAEIVGKN